MARTTVGRLVMQAMIDAGGARRGAAQVKGELHGLRGSVGQTNKAFMAMGRLLPVAAIVGGFTQMIRANEQFKQSLQSSFAIVGDLSDRMKSQMRQAAHDAAFATKFSAEEAGKSFYYLASAGLSPEQQVAALQPSMEFSMAGMFDAARGVDILTDTVMALGLASKDAEQYMTNMVHVSDAIVMSATKANATVEQFGEALMNKGALGARLMGYEVEEALAALMVFADKGFAKGQEGGQALWMVLRDLKNKAVENEAAFKRMGIAVFDASGRARHMWDIMVDFERALAGKSTKQQTADILGLGFSQRGVAPLLNLLGESNRMLENYNMLLGAAGKTEQVATEQLTPLNKGLHDLKVALGELRDNSLTNTATDWFGDFLSRGAGGLHAVMSAINAMKEAGTTDLSKVNRKITFDSKRNIFTVEVLKPQNAPLNAPLLQNTAEEAGLAMQRRLAAQQPLSRENMLRQAFGPDRTDLQRQFAFEMEGITNKKEQSLWEQWAGGKLSDQQLRGELELLDVLKQRATEEARITDERRKQEQMVRQQAEQHRQAAQSVLYDLLNPYEQMTQKQQRAFDAMNAGKLSPTAYADYWEKTGDETWQDYLSRARMQVPDYQPTAAKTYGSREALSALLQDYHGSQREKEVVRIAKEQLAADKKNAENTGRLREIAENEKFELVEIGGA